MYKYFNDDRNYGRRLLITEDTYCERLFSKGLVYVMNSRLKRIINVEDDSIEC